MEHRLKEAEHFIRVSYAELHKGEDETHKRLDEVIHQIQERDKYEHTLEELEYGS